MHRRSVIGIDLGGTNISAARYDADSWDKEAEERIDTRAGEGFASVLGRATAMALSLKTPGTTAVGAGVAGLVRQSDGIVLRLPNIPGGERAPVRTSLEQAFGLPVALDNDANTFALAEALHGAGKGRRVVVGVTMGTGVGGGIVHDGQIFRGEHGYAAEIGHMLLSPGRPPYDTDDKRGEVEQFLSGTAMGKRCPAARRPEEYFNGKTCPSLLEGVVQETAWMCVSLTHLLDPSVIVLGGSAGRALSLHLAAIKECAHAWMLPGMPFPDIAVALLDDAGTRGAALLTVG